MKKRIISKIISCLLCSALTMQIGLALTGGRINAAESITVEGIIGGVYYHGELTFIAPEGYELWCSHLPYDGYQDSLTLDEDLINNDDVYFTLRDKSDGTTQTVWLSELLPEHGLIVDNNPPYTFEEFIYFDEEPYQVMTDVYDGAIIKSDRLYLEVEDDYALDSVVVTVNGTEKYNKQGLTDGVGLEIGDWVSNPDAIDIDLDAVNHITITAVDDAENEFSVSFVMLVDLVEFDPTVSVDDILIGGTPVPSYSDVPDDYDGVPDISYWDSEENEVDSFATAGTYTVEVSFPETGIYDATSCSSTFEVSKKTFTPEVTVADILIGGTPAPSISNVPDDYNGTRVIRYLNEEEEETEVFDTTGTYTIVVSFPETSLYEVTSCSSTFEVIKDSFIPEVSVEDFYVGSTPAPAFSNIPDDYDEEPEIAYFTEDEDEVSEFNAAGSYYVTVIFPETDKYEETACNDYFDVKEKESFTPSISVGDIEVGGTIVIEPEDVPEDYDGEITYEFKKSTEADTAYSSTDPTAAGEYTVRATFSATGKYAETSCEDTFEIQKKYVSAVVTVENITVGGTPVVEVEKNGYDGEYTIRFLNESEVEVTDFTTAGTYLAHVYFPETDTYFESNTVNEFEVKDKKNFDPEVTVADITVGGTPAVSITGIPDDYEDDYSITYLNEAGEVITDFSASGIYSAVVSFPETDTYINMKITKTFNVDKLEITATLTVADIHVGETPDPQVTTISDGDITYEYKLSTAEDTAYSTSVPAAAGEYTVRATIAESDTYEGTECTGTFKILKNEATAAVTVAGIYVGGTPNPSVTLNSEEYDGEYTVVYENAAGEVVTEFTAAGEYKVTVTIPESEEYVAVSCENTFTISKKEATATVTVADIYVGETLDPQVTTVSDGDVTIEYKLSSAADTAYSTDVPAAAGEYSVRATIAETDEYEGTECTDTFKISKIAFEPSVSVSDSYVGGTFSPVLTGVPEDYDGEITYQYRSSAGTDYSAAAPLDAGTYILSVELSETAKYSAASCSDTFTISKNDVTASLTVYDIFVGETVDPVISVSPADYNGTVTYQYKLSSEADSAYTSAAPAEAGTYTVLATLPETGKYSGTSCTATFTISKIDVNATVSVADIFVGGTVSPVMSGVPQDYDGTVTFQYKKSGAADYSSEVPAEAGTYEVRALLSATGKYNAASATDTFNINKNEIRTAKVSVADITVGGTVKPVMSGVPEDYDGTISFEYKPANAADTEYSSAVPSAAGTYTVRATLAPTAKYAGTTCTSGFTIRLKKVQQMDLSVSNTLLGQTLRTSFQTDSDGKVTIMYKNSGAPDSAYSASAPTTIGNYVVRAQVSETAVFESDECTVSFSIAYLETPGNPYSFKGTPGKNGYYTSDVELVAPAGFTISTVLGSGYSGSVSYSEGLSSVYLRRSDGALTNAISISSKPKIDKVAPSISSSSGSISDGSVVYATSLKISVSDSNSVSLTINGKGVSNGTTISPGIWYGTYVISAEDAAGNVSTVRIILMAEWLRGRVLPPDVDLPLPENEEYFLGDGKWKVTKTVDGEKTEDRTVYNGNMPVYVNGSSDSVSVTAVT